MQDQVQIVAGELPRAIRIVQMLYLRAGWHASSNDFSCLTSVFARTQSRDPPSEAWQVAE